MRFSCNFLKDEVKNTLYILFFYPISYFCWLSLVIYLFTHYILHFFIIKLILCLYLLKKIYNVLKFIYLNRSVAINNFISCRKYIIWALADRLNVDFNSVHLFFKFRIASKGILTLLVYSFFFFNTNLLNTLNFVIYLKISNLIISLLFELALVFNLFSIVLGFCLFIKCDFFLFHKETLDFSVPMSLCACYFGFINFLFTTYGLFRLKMVYKLFLNDNHLNVFLTFM